MFLKIRKIKEERKGFGDDGNAHFCGMDPTGMRSWLWQPGKSFSFFCWKSLDLWTSGSFSIEPSAPIPNITEEKECEVLDFSPPWFEVFLGRVLTLLRTLRCVFKFLRWKLKVRNEHKVSKGRIPEEVTMETVPRSSE